MDIELQDDFADGSIYEFRGVFVYVPSRTSDRVDVDVESGEEVVRAATGMNRETPPGVVVFEDTDGARDAETYAQLWAAIVEAVALDEPLEWRPTMHDECWQVGIPAVVAAEGAATMAAYLPCRAQSSVSWNGLLVIGPSVRRILPALVRSTHRSSAEDHEPDRSRPRRIPFVLYPTRMRGRKQRRAPLGFFRVHRYL